MDESLENTLALLAAAVARPLAIGDAASAAHVKHGHLRDRVLASYRAQTAGLTPEDATQWLMERLAGLEARLLAVQFAVAGDAAATVAATPEARLPTPMFHPPAAPASRAAAPSAEPAADGRVVVACDESLVNSGFYEAETSQRGEPFRWLGPDTKATVFLPEVAAPLEARLALHGAFAREAVQRTRLCLNEGAWVPARVDLQGDTVYLVARLEAGTRRYARALKLDIDAGVNDSPAAHGQDDTRRLSLAITRIELTPVTG